MSGTQVWTEVPYEAGKKKHTIFVKSYEGGVVEAFSSRESAGTYLSIPDAKASAEMGEAPRHQANAKPTGRPPEGLHALLHVRLADGENCYFGIGDDGEIKTTFFNHAEDVVAVVNPTKPLGT